MPNPTEAGILCKIIAKKINPPNDAISLSLSLTKKLLKFIYRKEMTPKQAHQPKSE